LLFENGVEDLNIFAKFALAACKIQNVNITII